MDITKEYLEELKDFHLKQRTLASENMDRFAGTIGEAEWHTRHIMSHGKIELLKALIERMEK